MTARQALEQLEKATLSPYAVLSQNTRGRRYPLPPCDLRGEFQRDRDRIIHSKSFRRLKHKTQMLLSPTGDHYRTRLTHTMEVSQIARTIARALRLNEDLTEAIALGHDLGHTPFGHSGERALNRWMPNGFTHAAHSLRVVDVLEREGAGLNLTYEVRDGILNHSSDGQPATLEGAIVRLSDRIAYINHDIDDALRCGVLAADALPEACLAVLGHTHGERIQTMIADVVAQSTDKPQIIMGAEVAQATDELRSFLFSHVYSVTIDAYEEQRTAHVMQHLLDYYAQNPDLLPDLPPVRTPAAPGLELGPPPAEPLHQRVCDHVAGMTDGYALAEFTRFFVPSPHLG